MSHRVRKIAGTLAAIAFVLVLIPVSSILVTSWYSRWEASRLLAAARTIRPGISTEAETRQTLSQFERYVSHGHEEISFHSWYSINARDSYDVPNYPDWVSHVAPHLPDWINEHIWFLPYTSFSVSPWFKNGQLIVLEFREMQPRRDGIHPYAAIVRVFSTSTEMDVPELPGDFTGFHVSHIQEVQVDENGKHIGSAWMSRQYISLDERASPEQFARSFNFNLSCLTSLLGCDDARKILADTE